MLKHLRREDNSRDGRTNGHRPTVQTVGRRLTMIAVVVAALLGMGGTAANATAGDSGQVHGADFRDCPNNRCTSRGWVPEGAWVPTWCWRDGGQAFGTARWFRVRYAGADGWVSAAKMSPQPVVPYCSDMRVNETLFSGETVWSPNAAYRLIMQTDGNLVVYGPGGALWSSRTSGTDNRVVMQGDGNLVIYTPANSPLWYTGTSWAGSTLSVQSDGNTVMYTGTTPLWATSWHWQRGEFQGFPAGDFGNCTRYASERFGQFSGFFPALSGDGHAQNWNDAAAREGWLVLPFPATQSMVVFEPYVQNSGSVGHVAWVDAMQPRSDGTYVHVWEMNMPETNFNRVSQRWVRHVAGMSYVMAPSL